MGDLALEIGRQVYDVDGSKRALLRTDATSDAQPLGNVCDLGFRRDLDAELARPDDRT